MLPHSSISPFLSIGIGVALILKTVKHTRNTPRRLVCKRPKVLMKEITSEGGDPTSSSKGVLVYVLPFIV